MKYAKSDEIEIIKYLRFRKENPYITDQTFMTFNSIAKFLNRSHSHIQRICNELKRP